MGFDQVLADLTEIGYDACWQIVRASDVGAPHQRARLFVIAYPTSERCADQFRTATTSRPKQSITTDTNSYAREESRRADRELSESGYRLQNGQNEGQAGHEHRSSSTTIADTDFLELAKLDVQPAVKRFEQSMEQLPLANSSAQLAVRENIQKSTSFDMSSPQVAERLGAEIAEISVNGGTKKFEINPRNLGRMEIILTTRGSTEIIEIQTEHQAAKHIIAQHSQALQDILKSQGRDDLTLRVEVKTLCSRYA